VCAACTKAYIDEIAPRERLLTVQFLNVADSNTHTVLRMVLRMVLRVVLRSRTIRFEIFGCLQSNFFTLRVVIRTRYYAWYYARYYAWYYDREPSVSIFFVCLHGVPSMNLTMYREIWPTGTYKSIYTLLEISK
jgi:hypothetical protein